MSSKGHQRRRTKRTHRVIRFLKAGLHYPLALLFILLIGTGLFLIVTQIEQNTVLPENRRLADYPRHPTGWWTCRAFPRAFENALNDRFPFRNDLVSMYKKPAFGIFGHSTHRDVVLGTHDWLFFSALNSMDDYQGTVPFSKATVDRIVGSLQRMNSDAQRRGSRFLFVVVPDKQTVYPEFLPPSIIEGPTHRIDQLVEALNSTDVPFLDLRATLAKAKDRGEKLYYRYDTHWNGVGAFYGFCAILEKLGLPLPQREDVTFNSSCQHEGDMAVTMLGLGHLQEPDRQYVQLRYEERVLGPVPESPTSRSPPHDVVLENPNGNHKSLLIVRDSFGSALQPYLGTVFTRVRSYEPRGEGKPCLVPSKMIAEEKPDYVICLMVQRNLSTIP